MDLISPTGKLLTRLSRAWYNAPVASFHKEDPNSILGQLSRNSEFSVETSQRDAWLGQIEFLKSQLKGIKGHLFFEFNIPRMGRRIDVVLLTRSILFVLEFKVGREMVVRADLDQVWDYALDLKNFHEASHHLTIVPVLIATEIENSRDQNLMLDSDDVCRPIAIVPTQLNRWIEKVISENPGVSIDFQKWAKSSYRPTPTIIEAAKSLYANHSVEAIAKYDAGDNLKTTSLRLEEIIAHARKNKEKVICFVTGVPGAGKTLVGLNLATSHDKPEDSHHSVFLSGNGPLVAVLREALTRDKVSRHKEAGEKVRKGKVAESVKAFIQNVHHFRDDVLRDKKPPSEHVVIFDEAQRAWNLTQTANFMKRRKGIEGFSQSEPEFLISGMNRHRDWTVVICLVGGGQEIGTGEAGISAWIEAIMEHYPKWKIHISPNISDREYAATGLLPALKRRKKNVFFEKKMHLSVSQRSFRAENVSDFVKALLDCEVPKAKEHLARLEGRYPLVITRDLALAKSWIKRNVRGSERHGLVASSKAMRLKPHAIDIRVKIDPVPWFLNSRHDTRSSDYLEDAATEFQVQGLELDWICVNWDGDLRFRSNGWSYHDFVGCKWNNVRNAENQNYLKNAYRVLLTRARQGMAIFIPTGDSKDLTRNASFYDGTFDYLKELGIPVISSYEDIKSINSEERQLF